MHDPSNPLRNPCAFHHPGHGPSRWATLAIASMLAACGAHPDQRRVAVRTAEVFGPAAGMTPAAGTGEPDAPPAIAEIRAEADLTRYLAYGLHHNGDLRSRYERWRAALERIPQASALPDPVFSFAWFVESIETRTGPQERRYSLSQTLPWFGTLEARGDAAAAAAEVEWQQVMAARLRVERDIVVAFYDYAYLARSTAIAELGLELLRQLEPVVQQRIVGGGAGQEDLLRLQVELGRTENEVESLAQVRAALSSRLAAAMNLPRGPVLPLPELTAPAITDAERDTAELVARAASANPELQGLAEQIQRGERERELAELQRWPDMTLGVDYFETGRAMAPVAGSGDDPLAVRLSFNLPLWAGKLNAAERETEHRIAAARHALSDRQATLAADIEHAAFELGDAGRQIRLYGESLLPRARESLEVTRAAYRAGRATLLDVIDSERALLDFETGYWRACRDHHQSRARLEALIGGAL